MRLDAVETLSREISCPPGCCLSSDVFPFPKYLFPVRRALFPWTIWTERREGLVEILFTPKAHNPWKRGKRMETITRESRLLRCTDNEIPAKTPEERPVRNHGGNYGYTCFSLTTQTFRFGGYPWPIHRNRTPEPYRASTWDESGVFSWHTKEALKSDIRFSLPLFFKLSIFYESFSSTARQPFTMSA